MPHYMPDFWTQRHVLAAEELKVEYSQGPNEKGKDQ